MTPTGGLGKLRESQPTERGEEVKEKKIKKNNTQDGRHANATTRNTTTATTTTTHKTKQKKQKNSTKRKTNKKPTQKQHKKNGKKQQTEEVAGKAGFSTTAAAYDGKCPLCPPLTTHVLTSGSATRAEIGKKRIPRLF